MKTAQHDDLKTLWGLIKHTRFAMLAHRHADGSLHSHPLTTQNRDLDDGCIYFFVSRRTEVGQRLRADGNVNLAYANVEKDQYVSISGTATILESLQKKKELFNPMAKAWFPGGAEDPDLELVEIRIHTAEYWDVKDSKVTQVYKMAKAAVTGERPKNMGEHRELEVSRG